MSRVSPQSAADLGEHFSLSLDQYWISIKQDMSEKSSSRSRVASEVTSGHSLCKKAQFTIVRILFFFCQKCSRSDAKDIFAFAVDIRGKIIFKINIKHDQVTFSSLFAIGAIGPMREIYVPQVWCGCDGYGRGGFRGRVFWSALLHPVSGFMQDTMSWYEQYLGKSWGNRAPWATISLLALMGLIFAAYFPPEGYIYLLVFVGLDGFHVLLQYDQRGVHGFGVQYIQVQEGESDDGGIWIYE